MGVAVGVGVLVLSTGRHTLTPNVSMMQFCCSIGCMDGIINAVDMRAAEEKTAIPRDTSQTLPFLSCKHYSATANHQRRWQRFLLHEWL